jgi:hypothetical protein
MNPFTERSRITDPAKFTGRWREVSMIFERLERRRPVMLSGAPGVGKSSLLTHVAQAAGPVLELPTMASFFIDLAAMPDGATVYRLLARDLGGRGDSAADLAAALDKANRPVIVCLDSVDFAMEAGWGEDLLERLARLARVSAPAYAAGLAEPGDGMHDLMLVAAAGATPPTLSEPFAAVRLGALAPAEVRLLAEAYLDEGEVQFSPAELRALGALSAGHPAYVQRAAYHLYEAHARPGYDWRAAYLAEAREQPVPGAPLPDEAFVGEGDAAREESRYAGGEGAEQRERPPELQIDGLGGLAGAMLPPIAALLVFQLSGAWPAALAVLVVGYLAVVLVTRRQR